ncbi:adult-specific rigid cuticular protein 15.7-like [Uloborus diversus]|uniref:adult-specific rigid cuticular protein 15.7-like n=1 Tax=Uloborus diversus TaxID=327109 RepID=UPI00240A492A|nr:adult-specific rigid cuticular protein 15.7-like [Uloborus diversus]
MYAKVIVLCAALAVANASVLLTAPIINTGISTSSRQQDGLGNYAFGYDIANGLGSTNGRSEVGDAAGNKKGTYTITDSDGRARRVDYVADALGFRASVKTNEPGTALSAPAAALVSSPYAPPVAPLPVAAASLPLAAGPLTLAPLPLAAANLWGASVPVASYNSVIGNGALIGAPLGLSKSILL